MERIDIVIGDWSDDGHGKSDLYPILANKSKLEMQNAYKASCKKLGISFNHNDNFTGIEEDWSSRKKRTICTEYEESILGDFVLEVLREHGITNELLGEMGFEYEEDLEPDEDIEFYANKDSLVELLMWFIKQSLPDFEWSVVKEEDTIPKFNGFWDDNLNVQIGYGLYD